MFDQVRTAAGIHTATFKAKDEATPEEVGAEDQDTSAWTPPPSMMRAWTQAV